VVRPGGHLAGESRDLTNGTMKITVPAAGSTLAMAAPSLCPLCGSAKTERWLSAPDRFHLRKQVYDLRHCDTCSVVWLNDPPPLEAMDAHYGPDYHRVITRSAEGSASRWKDHQRALMKYAHGGAILDIGCSSGSFLETLKGGPWNEYGIEISPSAAERARARTGAEVFVGDLFDAPFAPESFDAVTSFDVLEHLHRPREAMEKVWEWLKPDGVFYVFLPNVLCWEARLFRSYWYGLELPRHLFHFSPQSLRHLMASVGFKEEWLVTPPVNHIEHSTRYVCDEVIRGLGLPRQAMAVAPLPGVPKRIVRKAFRMTVLSLFSHVASAAGAGPAIEAIFRKIPRPSLTT
jgi:SAM-dependent methyltransferase